ncbi:MAG: S8 family peptidase [Candidatus Marinimicrobia bacterium]|nr:S8 family peptidase [Candidatus Neomarinimicrobiota bacterium]
MNGSRLGVLFIWCLLFLYFNDFSYGQKSSSFAYVQKELGRAKNLSDSNVSLNKYVSNNKESITVWLFFTDKGIRDNRTLNEKLRDYEFNRNSLSLSKRKKPNRTFDFTDLPVEPSYLKEISTHISKIRQVSRWFNAVSVELPIANLERLNQLQFISRIQPLQRLSHSIQKINLEREIHFRKNSSSVMLDYGISFDQLNQINVVEAHNAGYTGKNIIIAMFDSGFLLSHNAFSHIFDSGRLIVQKDFVGGDNNVQDEGSENDHWHGTSTWSAVGGFQEGTLIGAAYGASFILAKTENIASETKMEEDNWIAAAEWVEQLGADVISSSLAYLDFDGTDDDYSVSDLDGNTGLITIAADLAVSKGIIVVTAMANEGPKATSLWMPADGDDVIAVGAVTSSGFPAPFSSRGPTADGRIKPDVVARGVLVSSASSSNDSSFGVSNGTSLSTPLAAGAAALVIEANPCWSPADVKNALKSTADNSGFPNNEIGWGLIDVLAAINFSGLTRCDSTFGTIISVQNVFPNPSYSGISTLRFAIPDNPEFRNGVDFRLLIYNILGQKIATVNEGILLPRFTPYTESWLHKTDSGHKVASGIYFMKLILNSRTFSKKFVVLK